MYLLLSLVFVFGLIGDSVSPGNPTCGPLSPSKRPCTTGPTPDSRYQYTIGGQLTCGDSADFDERGVEPENLNERNYGRAYMSLWLKTGSTSSGTKHHAYGQFGSYMKAFNHESDPWYALRYAPANRFLLEGKDANSFSGTLYPWIRVYGPSCKGAGRNEPVSGKGSPRVWWFYIYDNCKKDYGTHYTCIVSLDLDLGAGKYESYKDGKGVTEWDGQGTTFYDKYRVESQTTWAADQDNDRPINPPWTPGPLDPRDIEATRDTKKKDKLKKKNIKKKEKETKKKKEEKTE